ncbi:interferon-induced very large GTPase 1-like [Dendronephthya gigantea]|uniref:interferon-induced very large GTPase 1-like n=1 Tax=Dendronephthya gigantea TaxID=151771 RepID=UPI00106C4817|nr:interferon-induced very large GTPase 1-like [Dendronephthya gigantea]XP_028403133.1 interferon-induced very large GTPase 1-like [Dendronephthya gigantea]
MAESASDVGKAALQEAVHATFSAGNGGRFKFNISTDKTTSIVAIVAGTVVTLGGIYAYYKYKSRELELQYKQAVNNGLGGENEDSDVEDIQPGCLHVLLRCFTDERFLQVLEDFRTGKTKERLKKEFSNIGIETEGLVVEIENIEEVEERAKAIRRKIEQIDNKNQHDSSATIFKSGETETSKDSSDVFDSRKTSDDPEKAKAINTPGGLEKHPYLVTRRGVDEPEQSEAITTLDTTLHIATTRDKHPQTPTTKYTLNDARTVDKHTLTDKELTSEDQIPNYIFKMLMIGDYHVREFELKPLLFTTESNYDSNESEDEDEQAVNPMDAILGLFHCSDSYLRRYLVNKLSACQLSVPFLLPDPAAPSQNVTILLSALESVTKFWMEGTRIKQVFATEHPFPVVSFIRIGKPTMSKSSLINEVMSDGGYYHEFFFHKEMRGGHFKRKVVDGLVELSWFLPGGSEKQTLQNAICFANLRGDARYFKKQLDVLSAISSILFILLPSEYGEKKDETIPKKILEEAILSINRCSGKAILVFNEKIQQAHVKEYFEDSKSGNETLSFITRAKWLNDCQFLRSVRDYIQKNVNRKEASPLVELVYRLSENDARVNVIHSADTKEYNTSGREDDIYLEKTLVKELPRLDAPPGKADTHLQESRSSENVIYLDGVSHHLRLVFETNFGSWLNLEIGNPKNLLKLQNHIPVLAELERERYCPKFLSSKSKSGNIREDMDKIYEDIAKEKIAQKETLEKLDKRILNSLNSLATMNEIERNYTVNSLKHCLDKMSLQMMTKLREDYEEKTHQKSSSFAECSFGLEHIIRELAQLYQIQESEYDYAGAAADMLLSGQPLEILDGDSFYIPLEWFKAVFTKLEQKTKNAKIFVISVLGRQSLGKSTMLNTMFGLELPVSAGRCTRGAFASLLPVSDSIKSGSGFDYVLVIDTEGLKGSADPQLREHDNQLATFATGVSDVMIVINFGENYNEMKRFLEIAVHAFLKMNLVEERKMSCKIVDQNVTDPDEKDKHASRFNLKKDLDQMTRLAALQENCEQEYRTFDDIISFDVEKDVFCIPSLWMGNPLMAPVNPKYGRAVQKMKENVIASMYSKDISEKNSFSQFRNKVYNLWEAMLKCPLRISNT